MSNKSYLNYVILNKEQSALLNFAENLLQISVLY